MWFNMNLPHELRVFSVSMWVLTLPHGRAVFVLNSFNPVCIYFNKNWKMKKMEVVSGYIMRLPSTKQLTYLIKRYLTLPFVSLRKSCWCLQRLPIYTRLKLCFITDMAKWLYKMKAGPCYAISSIMQQFKMFPIVFSSKNVHHFAMHNA